MREHGIFSIASLIVGLPGETSEMRNRAVELAIEVAPDSAHFLPFLPLPGIPLNTGTENYDAKPSDIRDAYLFTETFYNHPEVRQRLESAVTRGGIRGLLAKAALRRGEENPSVPYPQMI